MLRVVPDEAAREELAFTIDEICRLGAQRMLAVALEVEVDFILGAIVAVGVFFVVTFSKTTRSGGATALLIEAGLGVAVLAVALTALSILVAFLGEEYVRVLRRTDLGVAGAIQPYKIISVVSGATTLVALAGALDEEKSAREQAHLYDGLRLAFAAVRAGRERGGSVKGVTPPPTRR